MDGTRTHGFSQYAFGDRMSMLWQHYVFRRGADVQDLWDRLLYRRPIRLLYIAGGGFDVRAKSVLDQFLQNVKSGGHQIEQAKLLLVGFTGYELNDDLKEQTDENVQAMHRMFVDIGTVSEVSTGSVAGGEDDIRATTALRTGANAVMEHVTDQTDVILDVSSLPEVAYLTMMTGILHKLVPNKDVANALGGCGVNFQVLVAEDASLDGKIRSEDPSDDLVLIPGFGSALHAESVQDWPLVWFPILGENRTSQFEKVAMLANIPESAEICPVLPHPSRNPRRADNLLVEYKRQLFDARQTPTSNILYAHESHPFEAYRQLLRAMQRYRKSLEILGGCRLLVTPLASKLITVAAGLACFEMRPRSMNEPYGVAIPYAEPKRYVANRKDLHASRPEFSTLLMTGSAYEPD